MHVRVYNCICVKEILYTVRYYMYHLATMYVCMRVCLCGVFCYNETRKISSVIGRCRTRLLLSNPGR